MMGRHAQKKQKLVFGIRFLILMVGDVLFVTRFLGSDVMI